MCGRDEILAVSRSQYPMSTNMQNTEGGEKMASLIGKVPQNLTLGRRSLCALWPLESTSTGSYPGPSTDGLLSRCVPLKEMNAEGRKRLEVPSISLMQVFSGPWFVHV